MVGLHIYWRGEFWPNLCAGPAAKEKPRGVYTFAVCQLLQIHEKFMRRGLAATEVHQAHHSKKQQPVSVFQVRAVNELDVYILSLCLKTPLRCF